MPYNLLLIPLLGGYIFVRFWNVSRIWMLRADKDRILIRSALAGFFSLIPAFFISIVFPKIFFCTTTTSQCVYVWWGENVPWEYTGTALIAFVIASAGAPILNLFCSKESAIDRAIEQDSDPMEMALKRSQDDQLPICVTMDNNKVYVGIVIHQFNPATPTDNIAIFPLQSGYRDARTGQMFLPVNYAKAVQKMRTRIDLLALAIENLQERLTHTTESENNPELEDIQVQIQTYQREWHDIEHRTNLFNKIIPVERISSMFFFDNEIFLSYFDDNSAIELTEAAH